MSPHSNFFVSGCAGLHFRQKLLDLFLSPLNRLVQCPIHDASLVINGNT